MFVRGVAATLHGMNEMGETSSDIIFCLAGLEPRNPSSEG